MLTVKLGNHGPSVAWRDVETGLVRSITITGAAEETQQILKRLETDPSFEVRYE